LILFCYPLPQLCDFTYNHDNKVTFLENLCAIVNNQSANYNMHDASSTIVVEINGKMKDKLRL
jgi:hypothetical protein